MYELFYGLKEKPFNLLPDPEYLYMSSGHENAYTHLLYAVAENKGFVIITGEIGSGKTTLINLLLNKIDSDIRVGLINNTAASPEQFLRMILSEFELNTHNTDKALMLDLFQDFLLQQYAERKRVILIIDEAQNLPPDTMEEIRMLSNLEAEKHHLLQIFFIGQPELKYNLQRKDMQQFTQRVTVHCHLNALSRSEVKEYIRYRLHVAGAGKQKIFEPDAIDVIHKYSGGIPRLINNLCDTALVYGFADDRKVVTADIIENVVRERESGGIFHQTTKSPPPKKKITQTQAVSKTSAAIPESFLNQLVSIEKRINALEYSQKDTEDKIRSLANIKSSRDDLMLELFQMLKENMNSRMSMMLRFNQLKKAPSRQFPEHTRNLNRKPPISFYRVLQWFLVCLAIILTASIIAREYMPAGFVRTQETVIRYLTPVIMFFC